MYQLRENIGIAMQDVFLFSDTIEGNIAYEKPDCSFEKVKEVAKMADANIFIKNMPDGYDTMIGERGVGLSGGQKQRLALARGLLRNRKLFLLDESTSSLDKKSALNVENIFLSQPDITVIFVSHQLHDENKQKFDRIIRI